MPSEHFGYGISIAYKVLPVHLIGFIFIEPLRVDSTDLIGVKKHWLRLLWRWCLQGNQIADSLLLSSMS